MFGLRDVQVFIFNLFVDVRNFIKILYKQRLLWNASACRNLAVVWNVKVNIKDQLILIIFRIWRQITAGGAVNQISPFQDRISKIKIKKKMLP